MTYSKKFPFKILYRISSRDSYTQYGNHQLDWMEAVNLRTKMLIEGFTDVLICFADSEAVDWYDSALTNLTSKDYGKWALL